MGDCNSIGIAAWIGVGIALAAAFFILGYWWEDRRRNRTEETAPVAEGRS